MIVDHRTYSVRPGMLEKQLALYEEFGFGAQRRHLNDPLVFLITETGGLNSYVHLWAYDDAADRAQRRQALQADAEWRIYAEKATAAGYLVRQQTSLMVPAAFAPSPRSSVGQLESTTLAALR